MEKEFNFTPVECKKEQLIQLFEENKFSKLDTYIKVDDKIHHITFEENENKELSDNVYCVDGTKYSNYELFINSPIVSEITSCQVLEINNDGPHYNKVFSGDFVYIERENIVTTYEKKQEEKEVVSELNYTFKAPAHVWVVIENLIYIAVILFSFIYGLISYFDYGPDIFNIGLLALTIVLLFFCFKDYLKYKVEVYTDKIVYPDVKVNDFNLAYKTTSEIMFTDIKQVIYVKNPKTGKTGREIIVITNNDGQRVISLNVLSKNQYDVVATKLIENLNNYYN